MDKELIKKWKEKRKIKKTRVITLVSDRVELKMETEQSLLYYVDGKSSPQWKHTIMDCCAPNHVE